MTKALERAERMHAERESKLQAAVNSMEAGHHQQLESLRADLMMAQSHADYCQDLARRCQAELDSVRAAGVNVTSSHGGSTDNAEVARLTARIEFLRESLDSEEAARQESRRKLAEAQRNHDRIASNYEELKRDQKELVSEVEEMRERLEFGAATQEELQDTVKTLEEENLTLKAELAEAPRSAAPAARGRETSRAAGKTRVRGGDGSDSSPPRPPTIINGVIQPWRRPTARSGRRSSRDPNPDDSSGKTAVCI